LYEPPILLTRLKTQCSLCVLADMDECAMNNNCVENTVCVNTIGSYFCYCKLGYTGNGRHRCFGTGGFCRHFTDVFDIFYPHMPTGKVWIYRSLFVYICVCLFVRLRFSLAMIKLAASNFERWFVGVLGRESPILENFAPPEAPQKAKNRTNRWKFSHSQKETL